MNAELVAQITKMVLERLGGSETASESSLTDTELKRWGEISASMQRTNGGATYRTVQSMQPLNPQEIQRWTAITDRFGNPSRPSAATGGQVRFHSHS